MRRLFPVVIAAFALASAPAFGQPATASAIPYPTVAEALNALKAKPGVKILK